MRRHRIYVYECESCGETQRRSRIMRCAVCKKRLCGSCMEGGICPIHFNELNISGKNQARSVHNLENGLIIFYIVICAVTIIYLFSGDISQHNIYTVNGSTTIMVNYVGIGIASYMIGLPLLYVLIIRPIFKSKYRSIYYKSRK